MSVASSQDEMSHTEPPLWSIGLAVLVILVAPVVLYSWAPTGALREGDTIFSDGQQRVVIVSHSGEPVLQAQDSCLLDPGNPLIILQPPPARQDGMIVARVQGNQKIDWPFCLAHAEVLLTTQQIFQKPEVLSGVRKKIADWLGL
jgi:hypothetical protein